MIIYKHKPPGSDIPDRRPDESDLQYDKRVCAFLRGDDVRSKGDLGGWATCIFHLSHENTRA